MTKKETIEEMAKCYCDYCMAQTGEKKCENQADKRCSVFWDCEFFYNAGYRKIPKEAIIQVPEKFCFQDKEFDMQVMYMARSTYDFVLAQARKEAAREFVEKLKKKLYTNNYCQEIVTEEHIDETLREFME
jgi:hypothetical protein